MRLLEVQRFGLEQRTEERWDEILGWLTSWSAGRIARELHLPSAIAADLDQIVDRRNRVVHNAWPLYFAHKRLRGGQQAAETYSDWLNEQARYLGLAHDALAALTAMRR